MKQCISFHLTRKDQEINKLIKTYRSLVRYVNDHSEKIQKTIQENLCQPKNDEEYRANSILLELGQIASELRKLSIQSTALMQTKGKCPHQE
jgi:hypothetical protein